MGSRAVLTETGTKRYFGSSILNGALATVLAFLLAYSIIWIASILRQVEEPRRFSSALTLQGVNRIDKRSRSESVAGQGQMTCEIKVVVILCDDDNGDGGASKATDFERQMNQSLVLIKSLLITFDVQQSMGTCVQLNVISNSNRNFERLKTTIFENPNEFDARFTRHLEFVFIPLYYPQGTSWMRSLFRPCATLRLFLPDFLPYDAVLYLDTDIIFFRSISDLWSEFRSFEASTLAGMAPCLVHYGSSRNSVPYYGSTGLNAGIMLMNLTRMRMSQWTEQIKGVAVAYRSQIKLADQDILNIYFEAKPYEIHLLACEWNFRHFQCQPGSSCQTVHNGLSAMHGNALSFTVNGPEPLFYSIFQIFQQIQLKSTFDIGQLARVVKSDLERVNISSPCAKFPQFKSIVLLSLQNKNKKSF